MKVLLYGGSFNPPTLAHQAVLRACLALPGFDAVWVLPSGSRRDKTISGGDDDRLQMVQAIWRTEFAGDPRLVISDFELRLPRPTATARTIRALAEAYPATEFWWAFGGDSYRNMANWEDAATFMPTIRSVVFTEEPLDQIEGRLVHLHLPPEVHWLSSTEVRAAARRGQTLDGMVCPAVADYIAAHGLYLETDA